MPKEKKTDKSVLTCPKCVTRFAIESALLQLEDVPRFHCSRCDNVFSLSESTISPLVEKSNNHNDITVQTKSLQTKSVQTRNMQPESENMEDALIEDTKKESNQTTSAQSIPSTQIGPFEMPRPEITEVLVSKPPESSLNTGQSISYSGSLKIPSKIAPQHRSKAPMEFNDARRDLKNQTSFEFESNLTNQSSVRTKAPEDAPSSSSHSNAQNSEYATSHSRDNASQAGIPNAPALNSTRSGWRALALTTAPLAGFIIVLIFISILASTNPIKTQEIIASLSNSAPSIPDSGLHISDVNIRKVTLDDGESVYLISGEIKNNSAKDFSDVQIEGQAFDRAGALVTRVKAQAASNLALTRVKSLSIDMIRNLQGSRESSRTIIPAGKKQEFALAISGDQAIQAAYYSARIYSAREIRGS